MRARTLVVYYSLYGHVYRLAEAAAKGAGSVPEVEAVVRRVPETLPPDVIDKLGATEAQRQQAHVPVCTTNELAEYDAIIFGAPTRFGAVCGQMRQFLDATGQLWLKGALVGKVGSVLTSSATQHGGQESTILGFHTTLLHHGMVVAGLPYSFQGQMGVGEITGCSPYGASTIAGPDGRRFPTDNELEGARYQGQYVAKLVKKLVA